MCGDAVVTQSLSSLGSVGLGIAKCSFMVQDSSPVTLPQLVV